MQIGDYNKDKIPKEMKHGRAIWSFNRLYEDIKKEPAHSLSIEQTELIRKRLAEIETKCSSKSPILYWIQSHLNPFSQAYKIRILAKQILSLFPSRAQLPDLPWEVLEEIFKHAELRDLGRIAQVNKESSALVKGELARRADELTHELGSEWPTYFGNVREIPPLPADICTILESPCPFWPGKKVKDTHMLVLIPETVNGEPLTLNSLEELAKAPKQGAQAQYNYFWPQARSEHGDKGTTTSHWVLVTKDVIPESRNKSYAAQHALVKAKKGYEVPTALEATTCIFMEHAKSGERICSDSPWTFTRCQESTAGYQIVVGGFGPSGLYVSHRDDGESDGVLALRKFPFNFQE